MYLFIIHVCIFALFCIRLDSKSVYKCLYIVITDIGLRCNNIVFFAEELVVVSD